METFEEGRPWAVSKENRRSGLRLRGDQLNLGTQIPKKLKTQTDKPSRSSPGYDWQGAHPPLLQPNFGHRSKHAEQLRGANIVTVICR